MLDDLSSRFAARTADEWEQALLATPAAAAKCNTLEEWLDHEQARGERALRRRRRLDTRSGARLDTGPARLVAPPIRIRTDAEGRASRRRHGGEDGALGGHRVVDISSFWAGPLAARLLAELGADVVKVEPPGGEGGYQLMPVLPNIYVDGNRSKRGVVLDLRLDEDRQRLLDLVAAADVVVENAMRRHLGAARRSAKSDLRGVNPSWSTRAPRASGCTGRSCRGPPSTTSSRPRPAWR